MPVSRWLLDTAGSIVALLCGAGYFLVAFTIAWDSDDSLASVLRGAALCLVITLAVLALLNVALRPRRLWLYPLSFSAVSLLFAVLGLLDAAGPNLLWVWVAAFTVTAAVSSSYATGYALSRWKRPAG
jgi:hypothetical protein